MIFQKLPQVFFGFVKSDYIYIYKIVYQFHPDECAVFTVTIPSCRPPGVQAGKVSHALSAGSIVSAGELLAKLELKDPSKVRQVLQDCAGMVCSLGVYLLQYNDHDISWVTFIIMMIMLIS